MKLVNLYGDNNGEYYSIGSVLAPEGCGSIYLLWDEWREAEPYPDSDSQFIDWLIYTKGFKSLDHMFSAVETYYFD
jgi:hypothetical protein